MALFGKLFGGGEKDSKEEKSALPWKRLNDIGQLKNIEKESETRPQIIFKHSTTCGISGMVLRMITNNWQVQEDKMDLYFLDLHANRDVSNEVAIYFNVMHQSPQLLVIKNRVTFFHASHGAIPEVDIKQFV